MRIENKRLAEAFINKSYKVLGLSLKPFSLWHLFLMESAGSPMLQGGQALVRWQDIRWAVSISRSVWPNINWPSGWELAKSLLAMPYPNLYKELYNFNLYLLDHYSIPLIWQKDGDGADQNIDNLGNIVTITTSLVSAGFKLSEVWNMPVGMAYWYFVNTQRLKGAKIDIVSPNEEVAMEKVQKMRQQNDSTGLNS
jgi:hypothetical protein